MKKSKHNKLISADRVISCSSISILGIIALSLFFSISGSSSSALDNASTSTSSRLTVKAVETVSVRLASQIGLDLQPKSSGSFGIATTELGVTTNDPEGFEVFLSTTDSEAALRGSSDKISTIENQTAGTNFSGNTWGYSISKDLPTVGSTYNPVSPTSSSILKTTSATIDDEEVYNLGFGVHITPSLPAGEYSTSIVLSVVANPATITSLSDLVYMQDMTPELCTNTYPTASDLLTMTDAEKEDAKLNPVTKQLYDIRDGKKYWVAKLADGNCWMTQNLALDLDTNEVGNAVAVSKNGNKVELNSSNTDINDVWSQYTPTRTETMIPEKTEVNYVSARSWNLGENILTNPTGSTSCANMATSEDMANCQWLRNVENLTDNYSATLTSSVSPDGKSYDAHYLLGNYYQWLTATAGSGVGLSSPASAATDPDNLANAPDSICPSGWRLSVGGRNTTATAGWPFDLKYSFYRLFRAYGYPETGKSVASSSENNQLYYTNWISNNGNAYTAITGSGKTRLDYKPMYFVRGGAVSAVSGTYGLGNTGTNWTSTAYYGTEMAYYLLFFPGTVHPAHSAYRYGGYTVRCLAR